MGKKGKKLIIIGLILVLLIAAYMIATTIISHKKDKVNVTSDISVSQVGAENITGFSYSSEDTNNQFLSFYREDDVWYYKEDKNFPVNQEFVTEMAKGAADVSASRKLEGDIQELSAYGLDNPLLTVHLNLKDGSVQTFYIGAYNESTESYYLRIEGDSSIYLVDGSLKINFTMGLYDLAQMEDFPLVETNSFVHVKIEKGDTVMEVKGTVKDNAEEYVGEKNYVEQEKTWLVSENGSGYTEGNQLNLKALIEEMAAYTFYREVNYKVTDNDLDSYGLKNPAIKITVDYQVLDEKTARIEEIGDNMNEVVLDTIDKKYVLSIGNKTTDTNYSDDYYVRLEGSDKVYTMEKSVINKMINLFVNDYKK